MASLDIQLLGKFSLMVDGKSINTINKPRLQSLLAYLVLHRDTPQFRYHLAMMFWPETSESQACTNLRNLVYLFRHSLPEIEPVICVDAQTLQWNSAVGLSLDVEEFWQIATKELPQNLPLDRLEAAVQIYQGDLLPSCYEEWLSAEREKYRQLFLLLLDQLIERYENLRRYPEAIAHCRRFAASEPFHKDGSPRLMRLLALNGEAPAALKVYHAYARLLKRELDIEPSVEMQALFDHTCRAARRAEPAQLKLCSPSGQLPLVGRFAEWQSLQAAWKASAAGPARMLLISGEAGIGKTRLVEEFTGWAARQGIRTAVAHCYATEGALPYAPVVAWLRALGVPPLERVWLTELSRLLPELLKGSAKPLPLSEPWQRLRLFEGLARAVLGSRQKTVLCIEDIHWCDHDTLEWLHYLLRFDPRAPLLIVATARSEEADASPACSRLLSSLRQEDDHDRMEIELGPLDEAETAQLAAHAAGKALDRGLNALIYQETEGSPLFIIETVRAELFKQGRFPGVQPLPYKARAVLENRICQLSPGAREMVLFAAAIGRVFSLDVLRRASCREEAELVQGMEELLQRRLVREVSQDCYSFSHQKLREAALSGVSAAHRQMLHRQVADALISLSGNDLERKSGEIAGHYEAAGSAALAVQYYQIAAGEARKIFANYQAIEYYRRAIELVETSSAPGFAPRAAAEIFEELGEVLALVGQFREAHASYERALAQPYASPALWRAQIYRRMSHVLQKENRLSEALAVLDQAEQALGLAENSPLPDRQEWLQIQLARSDLMYWGIDPDQMDDLHRRIMPIIQADGRPDQHVEMLSQQLMARLRHERYRLSAETVEIARRRLELVSALNVPYDTAWAQFHMGFALLWRGDPAEARTWLQKVYGEALRMEAGLLQLRCLAYLCVASRQLGDAESLREQCPRLWELASQMDEPGYQGISQANQGWMAWRDGNAALAEQMCASAKTIWAQSGGFMFTWLADWVLLDIAIWRRDLVQAEALVRSLLDPNPLFQPLREPVRQKLEEALSACQEQPRAAAAAAEATAADAVEQFNQVLALVKASGDL